MHLDICDADQGIGADEMKIKKWQWACGESRAPEGGDDTGIVDAATASEALEKACRLALDSAPDAGRPYSFEVRLVEPWTGWVQGVHRDSERYVTVASARVTAE